MDPEYKQQLERSRQVAVILTKRAHPLSWECADLVKVNKELHWLLGTHSKETWEKWLLEEGEEWLRQYNKDGWGEVWDKHRRSWNPWWRDL
jgi:hypothetical protein